MVMRLTTVDEFPGFPQRGSRTSRWSYPCSIETISRAWFRPFPIPAEIAGQVVVAEYANYDEAYICADGHVLLREYEMSARRRIAEEF
jgi:hypothetical protein